MKFGLSLLHGNLSSPSADGTAQNQHHKAAFPHSRLSNGSLMAGHFLQEMHCCRVVKIGSVHGRRCPAGRSGIQQYVYLRAAPRHSRSAHWQCIHQRRGHAPSVALSPLTVPMCRSSAAENSSASVNEEPGAAQPPQVIFLVWHGSRSSSCTCCCLITLRHCHNLFSSSAHDAAMQYRELTSVPASFSAGGAGAPSAAASSKLYIRSFRYDVVRCCSGALRGGASFSGSPAYGVQCVSTSIVSSGRGF